MEEIRRILNHPKKESNKSLCNFRPLSHLDCCADAGTCSHVGICTRAFGAGASSISTWPQVERLNAHESSMDNLYLPTWNPNDPGFDWKKPCFGGLTFKNRGHLGSAHRIHVGKKHVGFCFVSPPFIELISNKRAVVSSPSNGGYFQPGWSVRYYSSLAKSPISVLEKEKSLNSH